MQNFSRICSVVLNPEQTDRQTHRRTKSKLDTPITLGEMTNRWIYRRGSGWHVAVDVSHDVCNAGKYRVNAVFAVTVCHVIHTTSWQIWRLLHNHLQINYKLLQRTKNGSSNRLLSGYTSFYYSYFYCQCSSNTSKPILRRRDWEWCLRQASKCNFGVVWP